MKKLLFSHLIQFFVAYFNIPSEYLSVYINVVKSLIAYLGYCTALQRYKSRTLMMKIYLLFFIHTQVGLLIGTQQICVQKTM